MKRILIGGLHHESNSFSPIISGAGDFKVLRGDEIFDHIRDNDSISGIITTLRQAGYELIPTVFARAVPNGEVDYDFFQSLKQDMMAIAKREQGQIDAICLALHGSMRVKGLGEAEGPILKELRDIYPDIPIFTSLDMHATMSDQMHDNADGFAGYKTAPHIDCTETGILAAKMTIFALEHGTIPKSAWVKIPMLLAGEKSGTDVEPMIGLIDQLHQLEQDDDVLAASILMGFPWADNPDSSVGIYLVTKDSQAKADQLALELADTFWQKRDEFVFVSEYAEPKEAIEKALGYVDQALTPVYLSDSGDNPTAGASADNTRFLEQLLDHPDVTQLDLPVIYGGLYDPEAVKQCQGQVGQTIELTFGAAFDKSSSPLRRTGEVVAILDHYLYRGMPGGALALFKVNNVLIVLAEKHVGFTSPEMFRELGLTPADHPIIVCKLGYLTPEHKALAKRGILALTEGNTQQDLAKIDYQQVPRPIYPKDLTFEYDPAQHLKRGR